MRKYVAFLLALLLLVLTGCSSSQSPTQPQVDQAATDALKKYLHENFGGSGNPKLATSWYGHITDVAVKVRSDGKRYADISTKLPSGDQDAKVSAEKIASAVLGFAKQGSFSAVYVNDAKGNILVKKDAP